MTQISAESMRDLNFFQAVGATLKTVPGSMGAWSAAGTFSYAMAIGATLTAPVQIIAAVVSLTNETKARLGEKGIVYQSIFDHIGFYFDFSKKTMGVGSLKAFKSLPKSLQTTIKQGLESPAFTTFVELVGYAGHAIEPAVRLLLPIAKEWAISVTEGKKFDVHSIVDDDNFKESFLSACRSTPVSVGYLIGMFGIYHQADRRFNWESNRDPQGIFKGIKDCYSKYVPNITKPFLENPNFWFATGQALFLVTTKGALTTGALVNPVTAVPAWLALACHTTVIVKSVASAIAKNLNSSVCPSSKSDHEESWINKPGISAQIGAIANLATGMNFILSDAPLLQKLFLASSQFCWFPSNLILANYQNAAAQREREAAAANPSQAR